ncbi:PRC-barrel domain protein [Methanobrevibacter cuticularis]|uniref:PRC-barrel domain protein n=1 Tax=Methanobrevibacter cuticularis TaxID=47311 RepID=A0A166F6S8_9EURY|nr:PRC-barrel domain-containing protein [Methanobrevibacter cuticularis]KZX17373.1 PRC-barrel domain protein [Methanobrevibacter cuticularis]
MRIKKLLGMQVLDMDANDIGKVTDVDFNSVNGRIDKIAISLKKNILSHDEVMIHYDNIQSIGDYVLLKINIDRDNKDKTED